MTRLTDQGAAGNLSVGAASFAGVTTMTIRAEALVKTFGDVQALSGIDLEVPEGSVLGVLGPNGAGKTTTVRVLTTLLRPDSGHAEVAGIDVLKQPRRVKERIGVSGQYAAVDDNLTGYENLDMVARLYHLGRGPSRVRTRELLEQFRHEDAADRVVKTYSGGMRRRLDLAGALVAKPQVLFLDEPTTGLDPRGRAEMWQVLSDLVAGGTTVLLTTQYLEEADRLADSIAVVDHGTVIARGTADELKAQIGGEVVEVVVPETRPLPAAVEALTGGGPSRPSAHGPARRIAGSVAGAKPAASTLIEALRRLDDQRIPVTDVGIRRPTLDDVFLTLTGHAAENDAGGDAGSGGDVPAEVRS